MSFCEFQRLKFEALFSTSGALRYRRHQERDYPELYRPSHPDPGSVLRRAAIDEETLEEKYSF